MHITGQLVIKHKQPLVTTIRRWSRSGIFPIPIIQRLLRPRPELLLILIKTRWPGRSALIERRRTGIELRWLIIGRRWMRIELTLRYSIIERRWPRIEALSRRRPKGLVRISHWPEMRVSGYKLVPPVVGSPVGESSPVLIPTPTPSVLLQ